MRYCCRYGAMSFVLAIAALPLIKATAQEPAARPASTLDRYFQLETARLRQTALRPYETAEQWSKARQTLRQQLLSMLGLDPLPERTDLQVKITGVHERDGVRVENILFQSSPGLYVTGNLYLPAEHQGKLPAVLYVCGHGGVKKNGVSYGNKVHYQHHGAWFARHGYACLTIDSLQLGEIEGIHHGTYRYDRWWWLNRGYTPAGVEAWNCMRALDYLTSRDDVDPQRMGVTGRSGGGAYSWWITALDERIQAAVPVAGVTDLENHVVDGCVEGHCDCMYFVNTYRWDYPLLAALAAPRPLLISNSDRDGIFPLEGVLRTHAYARSIYRLLGKEEQLALQITAGVHQDTQELRVHAFRWLNHHLRGVDDLIDSPAAPLFEPEQLRVLREIPVDERNTTIDETFVPAAEKPEPPQTVEQWRSDSEQWRARLLRETFGGWPGQPNDPPLPLQTTSETSSWDKARRNRPWVAVTWLASQKPWRLPIILLSASPKAQRIRVVLVDESQWREELVSWAPLAPAAAAEFLRDDDPELKAAARDGDDRDWIRDLSDSRTAVALVAVRGVGPTAWTAEPRKQIQIRRRFYLLGQTLDGMRVWDAVSACRSLRQAYPAIAHWTLEGRREMAGIALYASLFCPLDGLHLHGLPAAERDGPTLLNIARIVNTPQVVAMAASRTQVRLPKSPRAPWAYCDDVLQLLNRPEALQYPPSDDWVEAE